MNLFVCIKRVPATAEKKVNETTGVLLLAK